MKTVFICYRRDDSEDITDRLYEELCGDFGTTEVFYDLESIPGGSDWEQAMIRNAQSSRVMLVLIGPNWRPEELHRPKDAVRLEIEAALSADVPILPVLIGTGQMPAEEALPDVVRAFRKRNGIRLGMGKAFRRDIPTVKREIARLLGVAAAEPLPPHGHGPSMVTIAAMLIALGIVLLAIGGTFTDESIPADQSGNRKAELRPDAFAKLTLNGIFGRDGSSPFVTMDGSVRPKRTDSEVNWDAGDAGDAGDAKDIVSPISDASSQPQTPSHDFRAQGPPKNQQPTIAATPVRAKIALLRVERRFGQCAPHKRTIQRQLRRLSRRCGSLWTGVGKPKQVRFEWTVGEDGLIDSSKVVFRGRENALSRCLAKRIGQWRFAAGQRCIARYTFRMHSN